MRVFFICCLIFLVMLWIDISFNHANSVGMKIYNTFKKLFGKSKEGENTGNIKSNENPYIKSYKFTDFELEYMDNDSKNPCNSCSKFNNCSETCAEKRQYLECSYRKFRLTCD